MIRALLALALLLGACTNPEVPAGHEGYVTVGLFDVETGVKIDPKTFVYSNPHAAPRQTY